MSSIFSKLRKEAKVKAKVNKGQFDSAGAVMDRKPVMEIEASTPEEIATLEQALTTPTVTPVVKAPGMPVEVIAEEKTFQAMGIYYNQKLRKFMKVLIDYDPVTGDTNMVMNAELCDSSAVASSKVGLYYSLKLVRHEEVL